MAAKVRIIKYQCTKGHNATGVYHQVDSDKTMLAYVSVMCDTCGSCLRIVPWEEVLSIEPIAEFKSKCLGTQLCCPNDPDQGFSIKIQASDEFTLVLRSPHSAAVLNWGKLAVYAINPHDPEAPLEVSAAATALLLHGGFDAS